MSELYSAVMQLGRHSNVVLLRNVISGKLIVKRTVTAGQAEIYRTLKQMADQHIPHIDQIAPDGKGQYEIWEEYIEGSSLEEMLQSHGCIAQGEAVWYISQLCDVLGHIHKAGLVHRDIKPGNIMVTDDGRLYLIDFDIAREHKSEQSADTQILGTQGYAAPEQFGFHQTDASADIYSAGVLLNNLLTGKMPQECLPEGSIALVVKRCIHMDPARRYRSVKALQGALRPYLAGGHPKSMYVLRQIPGFRSFTPWKMFVAGTMYALLFLGIVLEFAEHTGGSVAYYVTRIIAILANGVLFLYVFDVFQIRSRIAWVEKSRGRWNYPLKCILLAVAMLFAFAFLSIWLEGILT